MFFGKKKKTTNDQIIDRLNPKKKAKCRGFLKVTPNNKIIKVRKGHLLLFLLRE